MIIRKAWELIFLFIVIGILARMFEDSVRPLMPYIIGALITIGVVWLAIVLIRRARQY
jgi:hypothetical protein